MNQLQKVYEILLTEYGPQGWWPILSHKGSNPTKTGAVNGYHVGDHSFPKNSLQMFEICVGAILTQNTGWPQVERALTNLMKKKLLGVDALLEADLGIIKECIRPAGYFNQKSAYIKEFARFFTLLKRRTPSRHELLSVKGIGDETADSILLYAFGQPEFVIDAYTKRIFSRMGLVDKDIRYLLLKQLFEDSIKKDVKVFQEYHALIVEHAKRHCRTRPECDGCVISGRCKKVGVL
ncbi:MAG: endonuclease III domain-containing protein [Candidatus Woesearchaeota archaeon]